MTTFSTFIKRLPLGLTLLTLAVFFSSCDCMQNVSGTIADKKTKQALEHVAVNKKNYGDGLGEFTNEKGEFGLHAISGGLFGCPAMTVVVTKEGYRSRTVRIKNDGSKTIYLKKKK